jgi:hypothetical protein
LFVMDQTGSMISWVTDLGMPGVNPHAAASWSPDGERLVFGGLVALPCQPVEPCFETLSPVLVQMTRPYVAGVDSRDVSALLGYVDTSPAWSPVWTPDGEQILYLGVDGVRSVAPDGSGDRLVVSIEDALGRAVDPCPGDAPCPPYADSLAVSPYGGLLAFTVEGRVFTATIDGEDLREPLAEANPGADLIPFTQVAWGPGETSSPEPTTPPSTPESPTPSPGSSEDQLYEADGFVLQAGDGPAMLCLGAVLDSLPPQCSGQPIPNWDWEAVEGEESQGGVTWGSYHVVGTFDGTDFTVEEVTAPSPPPFDEDVIETPCEEPEGGWKAADPSRTSDPDLRAALQAAGREPDSSGVWIDYWQGPPTDEGTPPGPDDIILNAAFTGDVDRHREEIEKIWGGPVCVVQYDHTENELKAVQRDLQRASVEELDVIMLWSSVDVVHNEVEFGVVFADPDLQSRLDEAYGEGVVVLVPALRPVG